MLHNKFVMYLSVYNVMYKKTLYLYLPQTSAVLVLMTINKINKHLYKPNCVLMKF